MKNNKALFLVGMLLLTSLVFAQTKSGITNFMVSGYTRGMSTMSDKPDPDVNFFGSSSTHLGDSLLANMLLTITEEAIADKILHYPLIPVTRVRPANVPEEMNGNLNVMETVTDKKAFKELGYDEAITVTCRYGTSGYKTQKGNRIYTPSISLTIKIVSKDGKTKFKKEETLKFKEKQVMGTLVEVPVDDNSSFDISLKSLKSATVTTKGDRQLVGVSAMELLDWYKQVLDNLVIQ